MAFMVPVCIWINAVVLLTAAAYVFGRLSSEERGGDALPTPAG